MHDLLQRLRDRKLVQWALAYAAGAFALLQGLDIVAQQFAWPEGARRGITVVLVLGFFVALVLAWYHGERGAQRASGTEIAIIALLLAIGGGLLWRVSHTSREDPSSTAGKAEPQAAAREASAAPQQVSKKSIAVLPFTDLSPAHDQEYFSDGMSEEILNALAKVKDLKLPAAPRRSRSRARTRTCAPLAGRSRSRTCWKVRCGNKATRCASRRS
jgi:hypothetical protein